MQIDVISKDLGFFTAEPLTVQRFMYDGDERLLVWCNHAGAEEETVDNQIDRVDQPDIVWESSVMVCDKCDAYRLIGDDFWQDAPEEGISYE